jgi:hypothetical protein
MTEEGDTYEHLLVTEDFDLSLLATTPGGGYVLSEEEVEGVFDALDILDAAPSSLPGRVRLHPLQRERSPWWSITPPAPAGTAIRILVLPQTRDERGVWVIGPVTRHYSDL